MASLEFAFAPDPKEYTAALRAYYLSNRTFVWVTAPMFLVLSVLSLTFFGLLSLLGELNLYFLFFAACSPSILLVIFFILPWTASRKAGQNERFRAVNTYTVDDENLDLRTPFVETRVDWGTFQRAIETRQFFMLIHSANARLFNYIPKRAFRDAQDEADFRDLLERKIKYQNTATGIPPLLAILIVTSVASFLVVGSCLGLFFILSSLA